MLELYIIISFMIAGAIIAVEMEDLLSAVIALGAVGMGLSVAFLILKAPDLAITQLVVEILCLVILVRATVKRDMPEARGRKLFFPLAAACIAMALLIFFAIAPLRELPLFGFPYMKVSETYLKDGLRQTGAANMVAAVILDYRAYDTLGEATVLFTAVMGVLAVGRRIGRKRPGDPDGEE